MNANIESYTATALLERGLNGGLCPCIDNDRRDEMNAKTLSAEYHERGLEDRTAPIGGVAWYEMVAQRSYSNASEAEAAWNERMNFAHQSEHEWPTCLFAAEQAVCDHHWVDDSYGGPESGCIDMECSKCGAGFHHTLY